MVQEEVQNKTAKGSSSCTNGLLWLTRCFNFFCFLTSWVLVATWSTCPASDSWLLKILHVRAMDFLVELFRNLLEHPDWTMSQACTDSYTKTLKKFHGWLASSSFTVESFTLVEFFLDKTNCNVFFFAQEILPTYVFWKCGVYYLHGLPTC